MERWRMGCGRTHEVLVVRWIMLSRVRYDHGCGWRSTSQRHVRQDSVTFRWGSSRVPQHWSTRYVSASNSTSDNYFVSHCDSSLLRLADWVMFFFSSAQTLRVGRQEGHPPVTKTGCSIVVGDDLELCMSYSSSCHHSPPLSSFAPVKSRMETFCYRLTQVHLENGR